ncbi:MAG: Asp-tRNA(Asn)/Glu-tRNA(Gln) amidotransferase subunit GatA [Candidatus Pacebacteria bacterium]|jgi:aspartyl-tRNA(Asn)/glutamyl-tRNA(Gln) amidotransferase subunit A|nr:Asp-tRNA(Asn)/Glu-tRNA(Gln) amidotransferase subunit GatA [Candidatus Paceibacterota bacterium]MDD5535417.1 Asp-tRNA(Asn)/Glu-tRNA(Gln) amidotransferase subunit GatA [Candidatus Paceibacterota bacterium]
MIKELHQKLINKEITAVDLARCYLNTIEEKDKQINAFLSLIEEEKVLKQAEQIDEKINKGENINLLEGIPFAVKDNMLALGTKTTAGSKILENYESSFESTAVKLLKDQRAILIGKTNMDEFAMGSSTENSAFFPTKNPCDLTRVPGGSSGGSAAAVKSEMVPFALGSDTGGSVRQPASFCGIVGFKPSYGTVSRHGLIAMASSLDIISPLTQSVEDAEIIFKVIAGQDSMDSTSLNIPIDLDKEKNKEFKIENSVFGLPKEYFQKGLDDVIKKKVEEAIKKIEAQGAKIKEVSLSTSLYALPCYYIIMPAEISANLARFDGIRYGGVKDLKIENLRDLYFKNRGKGFGPEVRRRIILGTYVLSSGYYDAYYKKAQQVRKLINEDFNRVFKEVDFLITPTSPTLPFKIGEKSNNPLAMYLSDVFTVGANISGVPAINLPCAWTDNNLPVGLQLIGSYLSDYQLLQAAKLIEKIII